MRYRALCLPFDVTLSDSPLAGADVRELSNTIETEGVKTGLNNGVLTLNFTTENGITELVAGTPYITKWASGDDIVNPVFTNVTIDETAHNFTSTDGKVVFKGNYDARTFNSTDKSILFMGDGNSLYYPDPDLTTDPQNPKYPSIGAFRAYFELTGGQQARDRGQNSCLGTSGFFNTNDHE